MGGVEGEELGKGRDRMDLRGRISLQGGWWRVGHQEGVDAKACEDSIDIEGGGTFLGGGGAVLILFAGNAFGGGQWLVRLEGEVCPEVEVGGEVRERRSKVMVILLGGLHDVETIEIEGGHWYSR